ncbi:hypothetical protein TorRG33x02_094420 [Trema orientale]|uniref:Transmembrane protein n=1 Tax=Trema orientale TaxID=63057 RepID=A0A2P5FA45_TREOI|nr:hypothetical protein TorRG33x02_094420 [Trema orientale]
MNVNCKFVSTILSILILTSIQMSVCFNNSNFSFQWLIQMGCLFQQFSFSISNGPFLGCVWLEVMGWKGMEWNWFHMFGFKFCYGIPFPLEWLFTHVNELEFIYSTGGKGIPFLSHFCFLFFALILIEKITFQNKGIFVKT